MKIEMSLSNQNLLHELCLSLVGSYAETYSDSTLGRLMWYLNEAGPATKHFVEARLAIQRDELSPAVVSFASWIRATIESLGPKPDPISIYDTIWSLEWIEDNDELGSLQKIVFPDVIKCFEERWPASPIAYTAKCSLHEFDDLQDGIDMLQHALKLNPDFWPARLQLANYFDWMKRDEEACQQFSKLDEDGFLAVNFIHHGKPWASCAARCRDMAVADQIGAKLSRMQPSDGDYDAFLANIKFELGDVAAAGHYLSRAIPQNASRRFWLWVTKPEYYLEDDTAERLILDPLELRAPFTWSCGENVTAGDLILLYRTKPRADVAYLLTALDDAADCEENDWDFECTARSLRKFRPSISLKSLRENALIAQSAPLKMNFQGSSFEISQEQFLAILSLGERIGNTERGWETLVNC